MANARKRNVLHIDDDPVVTTIVGDLLKEHGYQVDSINDPRLALNEIIQGNYRVIIIDLEMPEASKVCV